MPELSERSAPDRLAVMRGESPLSPLLPLERKASSAGVHAVRAFFTIGTLSFLPGGRQGDLGGSNTCGGFCAALSSICRLNTEGT